MQIVHISDSTIENLDMPSKQTRVDRELAAWRSGARRLIILGTYVGHASLQVAHCRCSLARCCSRLLLLWLHLAFYLKGKQVNIPNLQCPIAHTIA